MQTDGNAFQISKYFSLIVKHGRGLKAIYATPAVYLEIASLEETVDVNYVIVAFENNKQVILIRR